MKKLIFVAIAVLVFAGCSARVRDAGTPETPDPLVTDVPATTGDALDCSAPDAALEVAAAFAPTTYCGALVAYLDLNDKYNTFMASSKKDCDSVPELKQKIDAIDIAQVLGRLVDDQANGHFSDLSHASLDVKDVMMAAYDSLIPSASSATQDLTCFGSITSPKFICVLVKATMYPVYTCHAEGVADAVARPYFAKALAYYLDVTNKSTKTAAVLEPLILSILNGTATDVIIYHTLLQ
jgi:hypothetical protein